MIPSTEAARAINYHRKDALVVSTSSALRDWTQVSEHRELDVDLTDCMDRAPAVGLGLSLAQPDRKVLVLDCDATLRTDLGSLATIGESKPDNLVHFVFDDVTYSSTDGIPVQGLDNVNFLAMAQGAGYSRTFSFDALEEFLIGLEDVMKESGPVFVLIKVLRTEDLPPFPERRMADGWAEVRETLLASGQESVPAACPSVGDYLRTLDELGMDTDQLWPNLGHSGRTMRKKSGRRFSGLYFNQWQGVCYFTLDPRVSDMVIDWNLWQDVPPAITVPPHDLDKYNFVPKQGLEREALQSLLG